MTKDLPFLAFSKIAEEQKGSANPDKPFGLRLQLLRRDESWQSPAL
jgi:hypothetical protein